VSIIDDAGRARTMPLAGSLSGSFLYSATLPANISVEFKISSRTFAIADAKGNAVDADNYRVPVLTRRQQRQLAPYPGGIFRFVQEYDIVVPVRIVGPSVR
jgi:hypothetical protein